MNIEQDVDELNADQAIGRLYDALYASDAKLRTAIERLRKHAYYQESGWVHIPPHEWKRFEESVEK